MCNDINGWFRLFLHRYLRLREMCFHDRLLSKGEYSLKLPSLFIPGDGNSN